MIDIYSECDSIIWELGKFNESILFLGSSINDNRLELFEGQIKFKLPLDFKCILKKHNGISLLGVEIYGIDKNFRGSSLDEVYRFEHYDVGHKMPPEFLPFSPDGRGNHYCLNLSKIKECQCPIVFWQWDFNYKSTHEVEECNDSFISWAKEVMIEWALEEYNYDGTKK